MDSYRISYDEKKLSAWTRSHHKRVFDVAAVLISLPILLPLLAAIALAVFLSSGSPIFFRQARVGRSGRHFNIYKFRTMRHPRSDRIAFLHSAQNITPFGRMLRRAKLDELPQVFNVLLGDMSLVGPRPKIPAQHPACFACRPGITGSATLAFAREELFLSQISADSLPDFYTTVVLPAKQHLDAEYMQRATLLSDLQLLFNTILGNWGPCFRGIAPDTATGNIAEQLRALPDDG
jgi:lipopolysaccharide/colanic/teichoic acid biosynthesis glycosyltransferase